MSLKILFAVQGQGRGHLTQAIALKPMLERAGHEVIEVLLGGELNQPVPTFVETAFAGIPLRRFDSPSFTLGGDRRGIDWFDTLRATGKLAPTYRESVRQIEDHVRRTRPDVLVNFYEPLVGAYYIGRGRRGVPQVSIAHQHMFVHPRYPFPAGSRIERQAMILHTRFASFGAAVRLALSLYPAESRKMDRVVVVPPLLRDSVFGVDASRDDGHYLVYLWRPELLPEAVELSLRRPDLTVHCFTDLASVPGNEGDERRLSRSLTVHQLSDTLFLELMATCSGIATTAGFESTCEAMYFGKPLMMVPTHLEQRCNALDAATLGAGVRARRFELDRLERFRGAYNFDTSAFRTWVESAEEIFIRQIELAAGRGTRRRISTSKRREVA